MSSFTARFSMWAHRLPKESLTASVPTSSSVTLSPSPMILNAVARMTKADLVVDNEGLQASREVATYVLVRSVVRSSVGGDGWWSCRMKSLSLLSTEQSQLQRKLVN